MGFFLLGVFFSNRLPHPCTTCLCAACACVVTTVSVLRHSLHFTFDGLHVASGVYSSLWLCVVVEDGLCHRLQLALVDGVFTSPVATTEHGVGILDEHSQHKLSCKAGTVLTSCSWLNPACCVVGGSTGSAYIVRFPTTTTTTTTGTAPPSSTSAQIELLEASTWSRLLSFAATPKEEPVLAVCCAALPSLGAASPASSLSPPATRTFVLIVHSSGKAKLWSLATQACVASVDLCDASAATAVTAARAVALVPPPSAATPVRFLVQLDHESHCCSAVQLVVAHDSTAASAAAAAPASVASLVIEQRVTEGSAFAASVPTFQASAALTPHLRVFVDACIADNGELWSAWTRSGNVGSSSSSSTGVVLHHGTGSLTDGRADSVTAVTPLALFRSHLTREDAVLPSSSSPLSPMEMEAFYVQRTLADGRFPLSVLAEVVTGAGGMVDAEAMTGSARSDDPVAIAALRDSVVAVVRADIADALAGGDGDGVDEALVVQRKWLAFIAVCDDVWRQHNQLLALFPAHHSARATPIVLRASGLFMLCPLGPVQVHTGICRNPCAPYIGVLSDLLVTFPFTCIRPCLLASFLPCLVSQARQVRPLLTNATTSSSTSTARHTGSAAPSFSSSLPSSAAAVDMHAAVDGMLVAAAALTALLPARVLCDLESSSDNAVSLEAVIANVALQYQSHVLDWVAGDADPTDRHAFPAQDDDSDGSDAAGWSDSKLLAVCAGVGSVSLPQSERGRDSLARAMLSLARRKVLSSVEAHPLARVPEGGAGALNDVIQSALAWTAGVSHELAPAAPTAPTTHPTLSDAVVRAVCQSMMTSSSSTAAACRSLALLLALLCDTDVLLPASLQHEHQHFSLQSPGNALNHLATSRALLTAAVQAVAVHTSIVWCFGQRLYASDNGDWDSELPAFAGVVGMLFGAAAQDASVVIADSPSLWSGASLLATLVRVVLPATGIPVARLSLSSPDAIVAAASACHAAITAAGVSTLPQAAELFETAEHSWLHSFTATSAVAQVLLALRQVCVRCVLLADRAPAGWLYRDLTGLSVHHALPVCVSLSLSLSLSLPLSASLFLSLPLSASLSLSLCLSLSLSALSALSASLSRSLSALSLCLSLLSLLLCLSLSAVRRAS
jgi:hypothetical protein